MRLTKEKQAEQCWETQQSETRVWSRYNMPSLRHFLSRWHRRGNQTSFSSKYHVGTLSATRCKESINSLIQLLESQNQRLVWICTYLHNPSEGAKRNQANSSFWREGWLSRALGLTLSSIFTYWINPSNPSLLSKPRVPLPHIWETHILPIWFDYYEDEMKSHENTQDSANHLVRTQCSKILIS